MLENVNEDSVCVPVNSTLHSFVDEIRFHALRIHFTMRLPLLPQSSVPPFILMPLPPA